jgi:hypothetical protein
MSGTLVRNQFDTPAGEAKIELRVIYIEARGKADERRAKQARKNENNDRAKHARCQANN